MSRYTSNCEPSNIYYNVEVLGDLNNPNKLIKYDQTLNQNIVTNSDQYFMSIVDFTLPLGSIPIMIAPVVPGSGTTNVMPLQFNFVVNGVVQPSISCIFVPENVYLPQVNQTDPNNQIITPFYYFYSEGSLINIMNTALITCYNNMKIAFPAIAQSLANPPFFIFNPQTQLTSLVCHNSYSTNNAHPDTVLIQINTYALNYLEGFSYTYLLRNNVEYAQFNIVTYGENCYPVNTYPAALTTQYIIISQNYATIGFWTDLKKIVITTTSIPI